MIEILLLYRYDFDNGNECQSIVGVSTKKEGNEFENIQNIMTCLPPIFPYITNTGAIYPKFEIREHTVTL